MAHTGERTEPHSNNNTAAEEQYVRISCIYCMCTISAAGYEDAYVFTLVGLVFTHSKAELSTRQSWQLFNSSKPKVQSGTLPLSNWPFIVHGYTVRFGRKGFEGALKVSYQQQWFWWESKPPLTNTHIWTWIWSQYQNKKLAQREEVGMDKEASAVIAVDMSVSE